MSRFWQAQVVPPAAMLLAALVAVLLALVARWGRVLVLERRWRAPLAALPRELSLLWTYQDPRVARDSRGGSAPEPVELSAIDVLFHLSRLDRRQLEHFHPERPPHDFEQLIGQFPRSESPVASGPDVGEQLLAQRLSHQGHDVVFDAPSADDPGDLPGRLARVDGIRVRLVASPDPDVVQRHLDRAPAIAIVTVGEHAQHFAEQAKVVALPDPSDAQLSGEARVGTAEQPEHEEPADEEVGASLAHLSGLGSLFAGQLVGPQLAAALRIAKLAAKGDAEWLSAASQGLVEGAATGAGGWAGARAGAMLGAVLGPVGAAAGGLLGGFLGKQLAESVTASTREKRLRQLLAEQGALLARVPQLAADALAAQARHLRSVALELHGERPRFELWPSADAVAREQLALEYLRWQQQVARRSRRLKAWLKKHPKAASLSLRGAELLSNGCLGWSLELLELGCQLMLSARSIQAEQRRLGMA